MFVKNFYKALASYLTGQPATLIDEAGNEFTLYASFAPMYGGTSASSGQPSMGVFYKNNWSGVCFGTGTAEPTIDDYEIAHLGTANYSATSTIAHEHDDTGVTSTAVYVVENISASAFTIREIGIMGGSYVSSSSYTRFLVEKTKLEEPVTIAAGAKAVITHTIRYNYPTA